MRILLVDIPPILHDVLARDLARQHDVVSLDGDVRDLDTCRRAAACDVVIHGIPTDVTPLEMLDRASRGTWNLLTTTRASRYILLSTMRLFDAYDPGWHVDEAWSPRPAARPNHLAPYLAEIAAREISRSRPIECRVLRLDEVVSADRFALGPVDPCWLHIDDAVRAITRAVSVEPPAEDGARWVPLHIVRGGLGSRFPSGRASSDPFAFEAEHRTENSADASPEPTFPATPGPLRDLPAPERIVIFGAGGPLGAVTTRRLRNNHRLRLTDIRTMRDLAASPPQTEGAPLPEPETPPPHDERLVDITNPAEVRDAVEGMDAIINCTVMRHDPVEAFRVNTLGAFNVMEAAVDSGIRRVVQTGPVQTLAPHPAGYVDDRDVAEDVPPRPGDNLYFVSKFLGQEICRIYAEQHGIACPNLLFVGFLDPAVAARQARVPGPFTISWMDAGRAMAAAVRVPTLPGPYVVCHVLANAPHDRYRNDAARHLLGWQPEDRLDRLWTRREA